MDAAPTYIKVREIGSKRWAFLTRNGTSQLRIHASRFTDKATAQKLIDANSAENPEWEWRVTS